MTAKRYGNAQGEEEYIRAFQNELRDLEEAHPFQVSVTLVPSQQKGVLAFRLVAESRSEITGRPIRCAYTCRYPNVNGHSLSVTLFRAAIELRRLVEDSLKPIDWRSGRTP